MVITLFLSDIAHTGTEAMTASLLLISIQFVKKLLSASFTRFFDLLMQTVHSWLSF